MDKLTKLREIRDSRINSVYEGFYALEHFGLGDDDGGHLSPFTKASANVESDIIFVLQDWASEEFIEKGLSKETLNLGYDPKIKTNINLKNLLRSHFGKDLEDIYTTNLFPFIKKGSMNSRIPHKFMRRAASDFLIPTINVINPKLVVCFGLSTFNAVRQEMGFGRVANVEQAVHSHVAFGDTIIFCQAHPGSLGQNNRNKGGVARVFSDWQLMKDVYCMS